MPWALMNRHKSQAPPPRSFQRPGRWTFSGGSRAEAAPSAGAQMSRRCREAAPRAVPGAADGGSKAEAELLAHAAAVALHHAAPVEAAQAVLLEKHALLAVPAAAAQQVAAVYAVRAHVAGAVPRAERSRLRVGLTEVG